MGSYFKKFFGAYTEASSKRLVCLVLVAVQIIALFLLMYLKMEVANRDLVSGLLESNKWLIMAFGGLIALEPALQKMKIGGPANVVNQDVQEQNIKADDVSLNADPTKKE